MRAVVWFLGCLLSAGSAVARRARKAWRHHADPPEVFSELGGQLDGTPRANLADWMASEPAEVVAEARELVGRYARTFCGQCSAGPDSPELRCPRCLERLEETLREANGDERAKWARVAELAQRGAL